MDNLIYWVGVRESEIKYSMKNFQDSIVLLGSKKEDGKIQPLNVATRKNFDHNAQKNDIILTNFQKENMNKVLETNKNARFMFYNQIMALKYFDTDNIICLNSKNLIERLDNKLFTREYYRDKVPVRDHIILYGKEIQLDKLKSIFGGEDSYVVQGAVGAGGSSTLVYYDDKQNKLLDKEKEYLVTVYCKESVSTNTHLMISKDKILILPSSVQIIVNQDNHLAYKGCDFIAYSKLSQEIKDKANKYARIIAEDMQKQGYIGICGIDFLIVDDEVYFIELNVRFQNSSTILNKALMENNMMSLQEMNYRCFNNKPINYNPISVRYSSYILDYGELEKTLPTAAPIEVLDQNDDVQEVEKFSYCKTLVYDESIVEETIFWQRRNKTNI